MADLSAEEMRERIRALEEQVYPDSMARPNTMPLGSAQDPADAIHTQFVRLKEQAEDPGGEAGLRGLFVDSNGILKKVDQDGTTGTISGAPSSAEFVLLSDSADIPNGRTLSAGSNLTTNDDGDSVTVSVNDGAGSGLDADKLQGSEPQNIGVDTFDVGGISDGEALVNSGGSLSGAVPGGKTFNTVTVVSSDYTASAGELVVLTAGVDLTLPQSPSAGDVVAIKRKQAASASTVREPVDGFDGFSITSDYTDATVVYDGTDWLFLSDKTGISTVPPPDEDWEHNDLAGRYIGDTGSVPIQTNVVYEGTYALGPGPERSFLVRDGRTYGRGVKVSWKVQSNGSDNVGDAALVWVTGGTSVSDVDGYSFYSTRRGDSGDFFIRKYTNGSGNILVKGTETAISDTGWTQLSATIGGSDLTFSGPTESITVTDSEYGKGNLGFLKWGGQYQDDIQFTKA